MGVVLFQHSSSTAPSIIDVRPEAAFAAGHLAGSASIPLEELPVRVHELPPASEPVCVTDSDALRAQAAAKFLRRRGHVVMIDPWDATHATATGPAAVYLWRPSPFLAEALDRFGTPGISPGRALDVACGSGRDAVYLALCGYCVDAIDVLPDALGRAQDLARRCGVSIRTYAQDLEKNPVIPQREYDLIVVFRYLQRSLFPAIRGAVRPGGCIVYETFHERNSETGQKPRNPEHLLKTGELSRAFDGFDMLLCRDGHEYQGRFFSSLLARRPI